MKPVPYKVFLIKHNECILRVSFSDMQRPVVDGPRLIRYVNKVIFV